MICSVCKLSPIVANIIHDLLTTVETTPADPFVPKYPLQFSIRTVVYCPDAPSAGMGISEHTDVTCMIHVLVRIQGIECYMPSRIHQNQKTFPNKMKWLHYVGVNELDLGGIDLWPLLPAFLLIPTPATANCWFGLSSWLVAHNQ